MAPGPCRGEVCWAITCGCALGNPQAWQPRPLEVLHSAQQCAEERRPHGRQRRHGEGGGETPSDVSAAASLRRRHRGHSGLRRGDSGKDSVDREPC
eukprot:127362-Chlamydomonas_euryale.AAC.3